LPHGRLHATFSLESSSAREYIIVERDGIPVLGILDADELEDYLDLRDEALKAHIRQGYRQYKAGKARPVEKVLAEVREAAKRQK